MKIKLYADVYPGIQAEDIYFNQQPGEKSPGITRISVEVEVPEELVYNPDVTIGARVAIKEK